MCVNVHHAKYTFPSFLLCLGQLKSEIVLKNLRKFDSFLRMAHPLSILGPYLYCQILIEIIILNKSTVDLLMTNII